MNVHLEIYSKAMYSSWCYHADSRTLFDCGEGVACHMGNRVFAVERLFITHQHGDHIGGLLNFVLTRNSAMGATEKPFEIYYPQNSRVLTKLIAFIQENYPAAAANFTWKQIKDGFSLQISPTHFIRAFDMEHGGIPVLGYKVVEERRHLTRRAFEKVKQGAKDFEPQDYENYTQILFAYCLDSAAVNIKHLLGCKVAVLDCTFIDSEDRERLTHYTLEEIKKLKKKAKIKKVIAAHISTRYKIEESEERDGIYFLGYNKVEKIGYENVV